MPACKYIDPRTAYRHFVNVVGFLNTYGRRDLIPQSEWPTYEEEKVVAYDPEEVARLLQLADVDETDVLECFLSTGLRNGEGTLLGWADFDARNKGVTGLCKSDHS